MSLSIADLDNAKLDVGTIAAIANSPAAMVVDRNGNTKLTAAGALARITGHNVRGDWASATAYQANDIVRSAGAWYIALDAHVAGSTFASDQAAHWRIYQGVTTADLGVPGGAALIVVLANGAGTVARTLEGKLRDFVHVNDYGGDLKRAMTECNSNTTIFLEPIAYNCVGLHKTTSADGEWVGNTKVGIRLMGAGMPRYAADGRSLVGGTVWQGTLFNLAHNFEVYDLGVDVGDDVVDNLYGGGYHEGFCPGINTNYPSPAPTIRGVKVDRVCSLAKPPTDPTATATFMHSMLFENLEDSNIGSVDACGGYHTFVSKVVGLQAASITARGGQYGEAVIFKSDPGNRCEENKVANLRILGFDRAAISGGATTRLPAGPLRFEALDTGSGHTTRAINIGSCTIRETVSDSLVQNSTGVSEDISISHLDVESTAVACAVRIGVDSHQMRRFTIGTHNIVTSGRGFDLGPAATDIHIGSGITTVTGDSNAPILTISSPSQSHGRLAFIINAAQSYPSMIQRNNGQVNMNLIEFGGSAGIPAIRFLNSYPGSFVLNASNFADSGIPGFAAPGAQYEPYKVTLIGAVKTTLSASNPVIGTVAPTPRTKRRLIVSFENAGTPTFASVDILTNGNVQFIGTPPLNSYIFLGDVVFDALV